jgi:tRNA A37 N6-isopentenylltransferase MiaA
MRKIEERKKAAIVVGGTNYYIETLLFNLKKLTERDSQSDS